MTMNPDEFTAEEKAYVESRGEQGPAVEETTQEPIAETPPKTEGVIDKPAEQQPPAEERVPVAAIQEERRRRKEAEKAANELRAQYERLAGRVEGLQQREQPQEEQQVDEDPLARLERLEREQAQVRQMQQIQATHAELGSWMDASLNQLKTEVPDAIQAVEFLVRSRERELLNVHRVDPARVKGMLGNEMMQFLANARAQGADPARMAVEWAKERGYQKQAETVSRETNQELATKDIARTAAGMAASKSLGQASGAPGGEMTAESLANMELGEFRSFLAGKTREQLKAILGG